jgi:hypothetical protein
VSMLRIMPTTAPQGNPPTTSGSPCDSSHIFAPAASKNHTTAACPLAATIYNAINPSSVVGWFTIAPLLSSISTIAVYPSQNIAVYIRRPKWRGLCLPRMRAASPRLSRVLTEKQRATLSLHRLSLVGSRQRPY